MLPPSGDFEEEIMVKRQRHMGKNIAGRAACIVACLALCLGIAACGSSRQRSEPTFTGPYAQEYQQAYQDAKKQGNKYVEKVLSDGTLTESEVQEATDRYVQCMADKGYTATMARDGQSTAYYPPNGDPQTESELMMKARQACGKESGTDLLIGLWSGLRKNPDKKNGPKDVIACFRKHGVYDDSVTDSQLEQKIRKWDFPDIPVEGDAPGYDAARANWLLSCMYNPHDNSY